MKSINKKSYLYFKKYPWLRTLVGIKQRCNNHNNPKYKYYGGKGIKCLITAEQLKFLWLRDRAYLMKQPSIDRKDNDGHYQINNCQFIELRDNTKRRNERYKIPILQFDLEGNFIREWESIEAASVKVNKGNITHNLKNRRKSAGGYTWRYKLDNTI